MRLSSVTPKSPIRDRDDKHGPLILHLPKSTGIKLTKKPIRAPRANTICERFSCLLSPGVNVFCLLPILHLGYVNITLMNSVMDVVTSASLINSAFNQIRQNARSSVAVTIRLLETIAIIGLQTTSDRERAALLHQAEMIKRGSDESLPEENDRHEVERRFQIIENILG
jgi:hypothetical protein